MVGDSSEDSAGLILQNANSNKVPNMKGIAVEEVGVQHGEQDRAVPNQAGRGQQQDTEAQQEAQPPKERQSPVEAQFPARQSLASECLAWTSLTVRPDFLGVEVWLDKHTAPVSPP